MRGSDGHTEGLFSYVSCEARVPAGHPLRAIRAIVDEALEVLSPAFDRLYSTPPAPPSARRPCWGSCGGGAGSRLVPNAQPGRPQADRRGVRLGQGGGADAPDPAPRAGLGRLAVHPDRRRLQPGAPAQAARRARVSPRPARARQNRRSPSLGRRLAPSGKAPPASPNVRQRRRKPPKPAISAACW